MKRVLCIRFPNWPIQCLQQRLRSEGGCPSALSLHTVAPGTSDSSVARKASEIDEDQKYIRAVFPSASASPCIIAVSRDAWLAGVRPGMPLAEARSMAQPLVVTKRTVHRSLPQKKSRNAPAASKHIVSFHEWQPAVDRHVLTGVAELTRRYAPIVGMDAGPMPDSLLLDITGCGPLFGGEAALAELLLRDLRLTGWTARIAIADTIAAVWALTHFEGERQDEHPGSQSSFPRSSSRTRLRVSDSPVLYELPIQIIPSAMQQQEIARLPITCSRVPLKDLVILTHLGIRSIGQLLSLPREDLPSRLSGEAVQRIHQLLCLAEEYIDPLPEPNPVSATWSSDYPASSLDDLRKVLQHLVENVSEQINRRGVACSTLDCELTNESGTKLVLAAGVVKPTQSSELMFEVLSLRLETVPIVESVSAISICARTVPIPASRQRDLFSPTEHIRPQEELSALIARLSNRLGPDSVSTVRTHADARPEYAVSLDAVIADTDLTVCRQRAEQILLRLTEVDSEATGTSENIFPRPLRLLSTPQQIAGCDFEVRPSDRISVLGQQKRVIELYGPERIQTAWWTTVPCHRDYYRATMDNGSQVWIYRELQTGCWFLHGLFD